MKFTRYYTLSPVCLRDEGKGARVSDNLEKNDPAQADFGISISAGCDGGLSSLHQERAADASRLSRPDRVRIQGSCKGPSSTETKGGLPV